MGYGTLWYVVAYGVAAAGKVYNSTKSNDPLPIIVLPAIAAASEQKHRVSAHSGYMSYPLFAGVSWWERMHC